MGLDVDVLHGCFLMKLFIDHSEWKSAGSSSSADDCW
jgi:hypothetical protein